MRRHMMIYMGLGVSSLLLFFGLFKSLQNETIYQNTLGVVSQNYERVGGWETPIINRTNEPFVELENNNYLNWDGSIYYCIQKWLYNVESKECYANVKAAFFPLFPFTWRALGFSPFAISIFNYLLFAATLALLFAYLLPVSWPTKFGLFVLLLSLPNSIIFHMPYSESLFMFCGTLASIGFLKRKYTLYFLGILLMAMVRPATLFVMLAIMASELYYLIENRDFLKFIRSSFSKILPFFVGYSFVFVIQRLSSGKWTAFLEAQSQWEGGLQGIYQISDWSVEGFAMNSFSMFFVGLPAFFALAYLAFKIGKGVLPVSKNTQESRNNYLLLVSLFYLTGIFIFTLVTSGGNFHSFFRFVLCAPFFYIALLIILPRLAGAKFTKLKWIAFTSLLLLFTIYMAVVDYGGTRLDFSFFGSLMLILSFLYLILNHNLAKPFRISLLFVLIMCNTLWNTYLLNAYLSNGWIFT